MFCWTVDSGVGCELYSTFVVLTLDIWRLLSHFGRDLLEQLVKYL